MADVSTEILTAVDRLRRSAGEAWRSRDFETHFRLMRQAIQMGPNAWELHLDLGASHAGRMEFAEAQRCFDAAIAAAPRRSDALTAAGLQSRNCLRYDWAEKYFSLAASEPDAVSDTLAKLAEMCERLRRTEAAETAVTRALAMNPQCDLALLVQARLLRSANQLERGEAIARGILSRTDPDGWSTRIRAGYELAANLDRQGRYDEAMASLIAAKAEIIPQAGMAITEQQVIHRRLREIAAAMTAERIRKWSALAKTDGSHRPIAILAGHPRSGTTLLEQVLDAHPKIVSAEETPIFFDTYLHLRRTFPPSIGMVGVLDAASAATIRQARGGYFRSVDAFLSATGTPAGADKLLIDKNPSLTAQIPALVRVLPDVKFIIALRDPRDVCLSCFMQPLPINPVSSSFLTMAGTVEEYCSLMGFWRAMKPLLPTPSLEVRYEDVVNDVRGQAERALKFLGLNWDETVVRFDEQARQKLVRSPTYAEVARPISRVAVGRWRRYRRHLEPYLAQLAPFVKAFGYDVD